MTEMRCHCLSHVCFRGFCETLLKSPDMCSLYQIFDTLPESLRNIHTTVLRYKMTLESHLIQRKVQNHHFENYFHR